jgi:hypothetical protein
MSFAPQVVKKLAAFIEEIFHCLIYHSSLLVPILRQINTFPLLIIVFKIRFNIILPPKPRSNQADSFLQDFVTEM